jgi:hypothetical protein
MPGSVASGTLCISHFLYILQDIILVEYFRHILTCVRSVLG